MVLSPLYVVLSEAKNLRSEESTGYEHYLPPHFLDTSSSPQYNAKSQNNKAVLQTKNKKAKPLLNSFAFKFFLTYSCKNFQER